jgi:hypothetical protein
MENSLLSHGRTKIVAISFIHDTMKGGFPNRSDLLHTEGEAPHEEVNERKHSTDGRRKVYLCDLEVRARINRRENSGLQTIELNSKVVRVNIDETTRIRSDLVDERRYLANVQLSCPRKFTTETLHGDRDLPIC